MTDTLVEVTFAAPVAVSLAAHDDTDVDAPPRTLVGLALPFGHRSEHPDSASGRHWRFAGPPDNVDELVDVVKGHDDGAVIGRLAAWDVDEAGMTGRARTFATTAGADALEEAREGVLTGFSLSARVHTFTTADDGTNDVPAGGYTARHLGLVRRPAFSGAAGLTIAASAAESERVAPMTTTAPPDVVELPTVAELAAAVSELLAPPAAASHPLAEFGSEADYLAEFVSRQTAGDEQGVRELQAAFAVPDQITGDNPGLMPPAWRSTIAANLDARRPAVRAMGSIPLPASGMSSSWPYLDPDLDLDAIIAQQVAEKSDLSGVKIKFLKGDAPIRTAGTVSDISYQLLMRSTPAYLTQYLNVCRAAWARYTEAVFEAELAAKGTAFVPTTPATDADTFAAMLFEGSAAVDDATGAPASVVGVAPDVWIALGGLPELRNPKYGTQNVAGVSSASTLRIDVNGLAVERWPFLAAGSTVITNEHAASFSESGALVASAEDVRKLGRDVAVWGMYEDGEVYSPAGVLVASVGIAPDPVAARSTRK